MTTREIPAGYVPYDLPDFMERVGPLYRRVEAGQFQVGFRVEKYHCNPAGICHGGMLLTVMDVALGEQILLQLPEVSFIPTVDLSAEFIAPGRPGEWLESEAILTQVNDGFAFAQARIVGLGGLVAQGKALFRVRPAK